MAPNDNSDTAETHSDKLADTIDGGGCAEVWEAMSDIRGDDAATRRSVLSGLATSIAAIAGLTQTAAADHDIDEAIESTPVQALLEEVNHPDVDRDGAEMYTDESGEIRLVKIPTAVGDIHFVHDGDEAAFLKLALGGTRSALPVKYRQIPDGTNPVLSCNGSDVALSRSATQGELRRLAKHVGADAERLSAGISSADEGFMVFENRGDGVDDADIHAYRVTGRGRQAFDPAAESVPRGPVDVEQVELGGVMAASWCQQTCVYCASLLAYLCPSCFYTCYAAVTIAGALLCISCFTAICGIALPVSCGTCLSCS